MLLNVEISHKVMRNQNVHSILGECVGTGEDYKDRATKKIVGTTVLTDYNQATYKIDAIDWDQTPASTFTRKGVEVAYSEYYKEKYNLTIQDMGQPLLVSRATARNIRAGQPEFILLVPELCRATGITDEMRNNFRLMEEMGKHTRLLPSDRVRQLSAFNTRLAQNTESVRIFRENFISLDRELVNIDGRRKKQEQIMFGNNNIVDLGDGPSRDSADWTRCLATNVMYKAVMRRKLKNWFYVYPMKYSDKAKDFMRTFLRAASGLCGEPIDGPTTEEIRNDNTLTFTQTLERILKNDPSFIMIIVPNNRADLYAALKRTALCRVNPVSIQVIVEKTIKNQQRLMSIATKVAIQVNCKLGGIPWIVNLRLDGIMIVGFDVTHDTKSRQQSFGAMVAHMNPMENGGKYFSTVEEHTNGEQLSRHFGNNIRKALNMYKTLFNALPKRILIYRDGVGDGQVSSHKSTSKRKKIYAFYFHRSNTSCTRS